MRHRVRAIPRLGLLIAPVTHRGLGSAVRPSLAHNIRRATPTCLSLPVAVTASAGHASYHEGVWIQRQFRAIHDDPNSCFASIRTARSGLPSLHVEATKTQQCLLQPQHVTTKPICCSHIQVSGTGNQGCVFLEPQSSISWVSSSPVFFSKPYRGQHQLRFNVPLCTLAYAVQPWTDDVLAQPLPASNANMSTASSAQNSGATLEGSLNKTCQDMTGTTSTYTIGNEHAPARQPQRPGESPCLQTF